MGQHAYNLRIDHTDPRDHLYRGTAPDQIARKIDLSQIYPHVFDQGRLGSCTGNAWAGMMGFVHAINGGDATTQWARLMVYYGERSIEHTVRRDAGAMIRDGAKFLAQHGVCSETLWPYDITKFADKPDPVCYVAAAPNRISSYQRITGLDDMLHCLSTGHPVALGFTVFESFESAQVAKDGMMPMPRHDEQSLGGHAVLAVGYDMDTQRLKIRNSWGPAWGDSGHFHMPFAYITTPGLADDFWTVRK